MEVGLSHETVAMIEERLGPGWAKAALWGVTLTLIVAPVLVIISIFAIFLTAFLAILGWTLNEVSGWLGLALGMALFSGVISLTLYILGMRLIDDRILVPKMTLIKADLQRQDDDLHTMFDSSVANYEAAIKRLEHAHGVYQEADSIRQEAKLVRDEVSKMLHQAEKINQQSGPDRGKSERPKA